MLSFALSLPCEDYRRECRPSAPGVQRQFPAWVLLTPPQSQWENHTPLQNYISLVQFGVQVVPKDPSGHVTSYHRVRLWSVLEGTQALVSRRPECESWLLSSQLCDSGQIT